MLNPKSKIQNPNIKFKIVLNFFVAITVITMAILMWGSVKDDSSTTDEPIHILSGYLSLKDGDFRLNPEHPFLGKRLAALPLLIIKPTIDYSEPYFHVASDYYYDSWRETRQMAENFFYKMGNNADEILLLARSMPIIFALIFAGILFWTAYRYYGLLAAIFSLIFYAFCPNMLAHARLANTDLWMTIFFFLAIISFAYYLRAPNWKRLILAGVCFGLAQSVKFSAVTLYAIIPIIYFAKFWFERQQTNIFLFFKKSVLSFLAIIFIGFIVIWANYDFSWQKTPAYQLINNEHYYNIVLVTTEPIIKHLQPAEYWKGIAFVLSSAYGARPAYLLGHFSNGGWWYYFLVAFLVKTPLPTIILLTLSIYLYYRWKKKLTFNDYVIILPVVVYMLISLTSRLNLGIRHLLPIYPFIFLWLGGFLSWWYQKSKSKYFVTLIVLTLFGWYIIGSLRIYPYYLSYFNEIVSPQNGAKVLADSNIDWGENLKRLKQWLGENKIAEPILVEYFWDGEHALDYYQINWQRLEPNDSSQKGYIAIGVSALQTPKFSWLKKYQPIAQIGYSVNVYKIN